MFRMWNHFKFFACKGCYWLIANKLESFKNLNLNNPNEACWNRKNSHKIKQIFAGTCCSLKFDFWLYLSFRCLKLCLIVKQVLNFVLEKKLPDNLCLRKVMMWIPHYLFTIFIFGFGNVALRTLFVDQLSLFENQIADITWIMHLSFTSDYMMVYIILPH